ncbi:MULTISPECIES: D-2-hydroxyacid dehydrogenase [Chryseobacterium]|jgi:D-3-phosphoglycerate dehydrogenase|uniref:3-phosphoglycerate dehydrogenase n=1 Tax=Chryseobacterium rhizosphaerae TaxID=395937 RepID=A0AAE3Y3U7_9FLAO|nr:MULTISPECIES: D-2-hydroxyacid dehydrogenase [Chryseobacterium]MBL3549958.1 D-2-hydroxyacid dehydrogenase [Chryseobacterium sp. KMC2]MDR6524908.1 D-3-phosphoglycerate dehydrogenase [Chryseobacterium rhizosphaerae]MDR6548043.1 D-3-phosphoglycerate dehydrogenase [Chryseobacterium rhizosphaerae]REC73583.1 3-phosphoglycerate dehydrogenase [Chryseobacterium rhizosphaerae]SMC33956.1 D-3-phosphoglycerate dehydrogenase [Chryseobacterium sp. YR221]
MKVLANDGISKSGEQALKEAGIEILDNRVAQDHVIKFINDNNVDVLLVRSATKVKQELIDACPGLQIIGRGGIGMDNIDVDYAKSKGIKIINTPTASSKSVAELVFGHFFSLARFLHESNRLMPLEGDTHFNAMKKSFSNAYELSGKTLGVIGFGSIGQEVVKIGIALGMKVRVLTKSPRTEVLTLNFFDGQAVHFEITSTNDMDAFLKDADFISINTPKTNEYIIDTPQFEKMKDGVYIVNTARGGVINEVTLIDFIESGKVAGAALDVFENEPSPELPLLMNPSLSLSPHVGGNTVDAQEKIGVELAEQIIKLQKETIR